MRNRNSVLVAFLLVVLLLVPAWLLAAPPTPSVVVGSEQGESAEKGLEGPTAVALNEDERELAFLNGELEVEVPKKSLAPPVGSGAAWDKSVVDLPVGWLVRSAAR